MTTRRRASGGGFLVVTGLINSYLWTGSKSLFYRDLGVFSVFEPGEPVLDELQAVDGVQDHCSSTSRTRPYALVRTYGSVRGVPGDRQPHPRPVIRGVNSNAVTKRVQSNPGLLKWNSAGTDSGSPQWLSATAGPAK